MSTKTLTQARQITASVYAALKCLQQMFDGCIEGALAPSYQVYDLEYRFTTDYGRGRDVVTFSSRGSVFCIIMMRMEYAGYTEDGQTTTCGEAFYHPCQLAYLDDKGHWQTVDVPVNEVYPHFVGEGEHHDMKIVPLEIETSRFHIPQPQEPAPCL